MFIASNIVLLTNRCYRAYRDVDPDRRREYPQKEARYKRTGKKNLLVT